MSHSDNSELRVEIQNEPVAGRDLAILFEALYIANLLVLPVIAFMVLVYFFLARHHQLPPLAASHLEQTISAGLWIAVVLLLGGVTVMIMRLTGVEDATLWMLVVLVFTIFHATMVLLGIAGLSKAISGKCWQYPLVGKPMPRLCNCTDKST